MSDAAATMVEYEVIWPDGDVYANRHGETRLSFAEAKATAPAIGGRWRLAETEEFTPGSVTDTCGICFGRFDLQYPADQHKTVETGNGEWLLVCDTCEDSIAADAEAGPAGAEESPDPVDYLSRLQPWADDPDLLPPF